MIEFVLYLQRKVTVSKDINVCSSSMDYKVVGQSKIR